MCVCPSEESIRSSSIHQRRERIDMLNSLEITHLETLSEIDILTKKCINERRRSKKKN